jgi:MFS family permease
VIGALVDRCWAPLVGALLLVPAGLAVGSLCQDSLSWSATLALLVAAGLAIGAETDLCPYLAARYFGVRHFGKLYAALLVFIALGAATSPPLFGWMYDRFGVYDQAMLVAGGGFILSGLVILFLGRYPAS